MLKIPDARKTTKYFLLSGAAIFYAALINTAYSQERNAEKSWSGMYMGGFIGYVRQENSVEAASSRIDSSSRFDGGSAADFGGTLGGRLGYNLQLGEAIFGMSLEINSLFGESVNTNMGEKYYGGHGDVLSAPEAYSISSRVNGLASFPISLGFVTQENNLVYMRGGYALASIEVQNEVFPEENRGSQVDASKNLPIPAVF